MNNRGETLIELVVSMALLSLMVTMLVTVFQASAGSLYETIETKRNLNTQVSQLLLEEDGVLETCDNLEIRSQYTVNGMGYSGSFAAEIVNPIQGSLYKFR